ncbi:hypothetical protein ACK8N7_07025 [Streptomyces griseobrunneus]
MANRPFLLFAAAMTGSYVLTFQVYLALPLAAGDSLGVNATKVTTGLSWSPPRWRSPGNCA